MTHTLKQTQQANKSTTTSDNNYKSTVVDILDKFRNSQLLVQTVQKERKKKGAMLHGLDKFTINQLQYQTVEKREEKSAL